VKGKVDLPGKQLSEGPKKSSWDEVKDQPKWSMREEASQINRQTEAEAERPEEEGIAASRSRSSRNTEGGAGQKGCPQTREDEIVKPLPGPSRGVEIGGKND